MPSRKKPAGYEKKLLVFLGLFLSFFVLEAGLRLAGFALTSLQDIRNRLALAKVGDYRILCLGESTTQGQYPRYLEARLNQNDRGVRFVVFDQGRGGTDSGNILRQTEAYLDKYKPNMVVAMMGVNDGEATHIFHDDPTSSRAKLFLRSFKTYKLARLLWLHAAIRASELGLSVSRVAASQNEGGPYDDSYEQLALAEAALKRDVELDPRSASAHIALGLFYSQYDERQGEAAVSFKKALELDPRNGSAYVLLGSMYLDLEEFVPAEANLKKALELDPRNERAYFNLGRVYKVWMRLAQSEASFKKALELDPGNARAYANLGWIYRERGQFALAAASLEKSLERAPKAQGASILLAETYMKLGRRETADRFMRKSLEFFGSEAHPRTLARFAAIYEKEGRTALSREYYDRAGRAAVSRDHPTAHNYWALKTMLDRGKIRLVSVQYPMRPVAVLKKMFEDQQDDIIFVDNEQIFRDAVSRDGSAVYFRDMFGGNFGHCTLKGNQLLGENIAKAILRELQGG